MRISDWSSDVCSSDLDGLDFLRGGAFGDRAKVELNGAIGRADRAVGVDRHVADPRSFMQPLRDFDCGGWRATDRIVAGVTTLGGNQATYCRIASTIHLTS